MDIGCVSVFEVGKSEKWSVAGEYKLIVSSKWKLWAKLICETFNVELCTVSSRIRFFVVKLELETWDPKTMGFINN